MTQTPYGFRIVGATTEARRLINWAAAFGAYAACDELADVDSEAYLSAFTFDADVRLRSDTCGRIDVKGYSGVCAAPFVWFDIDREGGLDDALRHAGRLAASLDERLKMPDDALLVFFSGSKGFHLGVPTALWSPEPSVDFHKTARRFAEALAETAGVTIDTGVYDKVRAFRAPNSRHPKTGLFKRRLTLDELLNLSLDRILKMAKRPEPFDVSMPATHCGEATVVWATAVDQVHRQTEAVVQRRAAGGPSALNRLTLDFIREGATNGERATRLFSAAANLAEFNCPSALAHALLTEAARDAGLPPSEVRRQIDCGLAAGGAS